MTRLASSHILWVVSGSPGSARPRRGWKTRASRLHWDSGFACPSVADSHCASKLAAWSRSSAPTPRSSAARIRPASYARSTLTDRPSCRARRWREWRTRFDRCAAAGEGSRGERLRALRDQRKTREQPLVERRERQRLTIRELNEQGVVGGDSGLQGAPERPAPQRSIEWIPSWPA